MKKAKTESKYLCRKCNSFQYFKVVESYLLSREFEVAECIKCKTRGWLK